MIINICLQDTFDLSPDEFVVMQYIGFGFGISIKK